MTGRGPLERGDARGAGKHCVLPEEEPLIADPGSGLTGLPYTTEDEIREAAENFQAYLEILREWDEEEKRKAEDKRSPAACSPEIDDPAADDVESSLGVIGT